MASGPTNGIDTFEARGEYFEFKRFPEQGKLRTSVLEPLVIRVFVEGKRGRT